MEGSIASIITYLRETKISEELLKRYDMRTNDCEALYELCADNFLDGIYLAFQFGRAKGYRAAKAEARR